MKSKLTFSRHCSHCVANKALSKNAPLTQVMRLLKEARGYIDAAETEENEVQFTLATEIDEILREGLG